jgi:hypothetical protein
VLVTAPLAANALTYTGSLTYEPPAVDPTDEVIVTGDDWIPYTATFTWEVTDEDNSYPGFPWKYHYTFELIGATKGAISHVSVEASEGISAADITGLTGASLDGIGLLPVPNNSQMPEQMYGIKVVPAGTGETWVLDWTLFSKRVPVWGDFYVKDGKGKDAWNYNNDGLGNEVGFLDPDGLDATLDDLDPSNAPGEGTADNHYFYHVLRPDSVGTPPIPEPLTMLTVLVGLGGVGHYVRRRLKAR